MSTEVKTLLPTERVRLRAEATDWRDAVRVVGALLVDSGAVEPRYIESMIETAEKFGPYIVIAPGIAMPHGSPDAGVLEDSLALVTLRTPVKFGHETNDPVEVVLALAAREKGTHIEHLALVAASIQRLLDRGEGWRPLVEAQDAEEAIGLLMNTNEGDQR